MSDEFEELLRALGGERPLPIDARVQLEATLVGRAWDQPEGPPPETLERIAEAIARPELLLPGIDGPRDLPEHARISIHAALIVPPRHIVRRAMAVAAAVLLVAGGVTAGVRTSSRDQNAALGRDPGTGVVTDVVVGLDDTTALSPGAGLIAAPIVLPTGFLAETTVGGILLHQGRIGPAPPYTLPTQAGPTDGPASAPLVTMPGTSTDSATEPESKPSPSRAQPLTPLDIAVATGDQDEESGFEAYLALANKSGVGGYRLRVGTAHPIALINLSDHPIASPHGPTLENFAPPASELRGSVFGFASAVEDRAHVLANGVFPGDAGGKTAVIYYYAAGPYQTMYPDAIAAVLDARNVTVIREELRPTQPIVLLPADAAFLSLPASIARSWAAAARQEGYRPPSGIAAVSSLADEVAAQVLPDGVLVESPYALPGQGDERGAMEAAGVPMNARAIHGWVTAKMLCYALWLSGAHTADEIPAAIASLQEYANGFAPPYRTKQDSNIRVPQALLYRTDGGRLVPLSTGFRTDDFKG